MTDLHAGHFGTVQLLLTYISHQALQCVQGHLQSTLLSSLRLPSAQRNILVSSSRTIDSAEVCTLGNEAFAVGLWVGLSWPFMVL